MKLYLLRHGEAHDIGEEGIRMDKDRFLTPMGEIQVRRAAATLAKNRIAIDTVLTSPYPRARRSAEIVVECLPRKPKLIDCPALMPSSDLEQVIGVLLKRSPGEKILLVGHVPLLGAIVSYLVWGRGQPEVTFRKAGMACLSILRLGPKPAARLEWLLTPEHY